MESKKENKEKLIKFCSEHSDYELCKYAIEHHYHIYAPCCEDANKTLDILKRVCDNSNGKYEYVLGWLISKDCCGEYDGAKVCIKVDGIEYTYHIWIPSSLITFTHRLGWAMETPVVILNIDEFIKGVLCVMSCQYIVAYSIES